MVSSSCPRFRPAKMIVRGLFGKYPAILNISRTGRVTFMYEGVLISPQTEHEGNKLQRTKSRVIIHTPHEPQYISQPVALTFQATHKHQRRMSFQPGLHGSNDPRVGRKMANFQLFFHSREQVVDRRGQIRRIGWVIKSLEAQIGQFLVGCKCPVSRGIIMQEQDPFGDLPAAFLLQNVIQLHQQK